MIAGNLARFPEGTWQDLEKAGMQEPTVLGSTMNFGIARD